MGGGRWVVGRGRDWRLEELAGRCPPRGQGFPPLARPLWRTPGSGGAGRADGSPEGLPGSCLGAGTRRGPRSRATEGWEHSLWPSGPGGCAGAATRSRKPAEQFAEGRRPVAAGVRRDWLGTRPSRRPAAALLAACTFPAVERGFPALLSPLALSARGRFREDPRRPGLRMKDPRPWGKRRVRGVSLWLARLFCLYSLQNLPDK